MKETSGYEDLSVRWVSFGSGCGGCGLDPDSKRSEPGKEPIMCANGSPQCRIADFLLLSMFVMLLVCPTN